MQKKIKYAKSNYPIIFSPISMEEDITTWVNTYLSETHYHIQFRNHPIDFFLRLDGNHYWQIIAKLQIKLNLSWWILVENPLCRQEKRNPPDDKYELSRPAMLKLDTISIWPRMGYSQTSKGTPYSFELKESQLIRGLNSIMWQRQQQETKELLWRFDF